MKLEASCNMLQVLVGKFCLPVFVLGQASCFFSLLQFLCQAKANRLALYLAYRYEIGINFLIQHVKLFL